MKPELVEQIKKMRNDGVATNVIARELGISTWAIFAAMLPEEEARTRRVWNSMKQRCLNPKNTRYSTYGGRGITVCERWKSYNNFVADMGLRPAGLTLERKNNDLGYNPENCVWADWATQYANKRPPTEAWIAGTRKRFVLFRGQKVGIREVAAVAGVAPITIWQRWQSGLRTDDGLLYGRANFTSRPLSKLWPMPDRSERDGLVRSWVALGLPKTAISQLLDISKGTISRILRFSPQERARRTTGGANMRAKTHCPHGHPYSPENTILYRGSRFCRTCKKLETNAREKRTKRYLRESRRAWTKEYLKKKRLARAAVKAMLAGNGTREAKG